MRVMDLVTTPGGPGANEDRVAHAGTLAWVIDGATDLYDDAVLPGDSDVEWLVDVVDASLTRAGVESYRGSGSTLLESIASEVAQRQTAYGFPAGRVPPACSIALFVDQGPAYEITRIGDATAVVAGRRSITLATDYFDRREATAVRAREADPARVIAAMHERRLHTMTAGDGESVFSGHPRRRLQPHRLACEWRAGDRILLCTDGFARLVTDYGIYERWTEVVTDAGERGLAYLEKLIRDSENVSRGDGDRFKRADDVAAILLTQS